MEWRSKHASGETLVRGFSSRWATRPSSINCLLASSLFSDNTIYCIGGIGGKGGTYEKRLDTVECLELGEEGGKRWKQLASMSTPRSSHTCEVMDGLIYVVGGGDGKDWLCSAEVGQRLRREEKNTEVFV